MKPSNLVFLFIIASVLSSCGYMKKEQERRIEAMMENMNDTTVNEPNGPYAINAYHTSLMREGGELERTFIDKCFMERVVVQDVQKFIDDGGHMNRYIPYTYEYSRKKFGAMIPIVKWFITDPYVHKKEDYKITPFSAFLFSQSQNKLSICVFMLEHGARADIADPDSAYPMDYLIRLSGLFSNDLKMDLKIIDTLIHYGADPAKTNLEYLRSNTKLTLEILKRGGNPKTIDPNDIVSNMRPDQIEIEKIIEYGLDYSKMDGDHFVLFAYDPENTLIKMLDHGFDPNTRLKNDHFLIESAIKWNKLELVKFLVEHGANKTIDNENPYEYAQHAFNVSEEILAYLKGKFNSK